MKFKIVSKLQNKVLAVLFLVMFIPLLITSFYSIRIFIQAFKENIREEFRHYSHHAAQHIEEFFQSIERDVNTAKNNPYFIRYIEEKWVTEKRDLHRRVSEDFLFISNIRKIYNQIRYIDEKGDEVIRITFDGLTSKAVPSHKLQNKKERYYVQESLNLPPGKIYISHLDLNREIGKIETPVVPTLRYATPVHTGKGKKKGIIVFNVVADIFLNEIEESHVLTGEKTFLVNRDGFYLKHPDPSKEWGGPDDLNTGENIFRDYPEEVTSKIFSGRSGVIEYKDEMISYDYIFPGHDPDHYWVFVDSHPASEMYQSVNVFIRTFAVITLVSTIAAVVIGIILAMHFTTPLRQLTLGAQKIAGGDLSHRVLIKTGDEIEDLGNSFNEMAAALSGREQELKKGCEDLKQTQSHLLQSEKMASIGQLAAGVAHEINNPIGFVNGNLNILHEYGEDIKKVIAKYEELKETDNSERTWKELDELSREIDLEYLMKDLDNVISESLEGTDRVKKIVKNLRDFSHVDESEQQYADINKGLENTLNIIWHEIKYKAEVSTDYGELPEILCYPMQLNQVFMNILVNAAQAIETRGTIAIVSRVYKDEHIEVRISDTGRGISEKDLGNIFNPFFTTKEPGQGTGLGLSMAYGIVQKHGGRIDVRSKVGEGSVFIITLPVNHPDGNNEKEG